MWMAAMAHITIEWCNSLIGINVKHANRTVYRQIFWHFHRQQREYFFEIQWFKVFGGEAFKVVPNFHIARVWSRVVNFGRFATAIFAFRIEYLILLLNLFHYPRLRHTAIEPLLIHSIVCSVDSRCCSYNIEERHLHDLFGLVLPREKHHGYIEGYWEQKDEHLESRLIV